MSDLAVLALAGAFSALTYGLVILCDRLAGGGK
jgi:hypothetical protein